MKDLKQIAQLFAIEGEIAEVKPFGDGLINDSYLVRTVGEGDDYVMQRINTRVFPDVEMVQRNIQTVTDHIRRKLAQQGETDLKHRVLQLIPTVSNNPNVTKDNKALNDPKNLFAVTEDGTWRMMVYIDHTVTKEEVNADNARAAGEAFGRFQAMLADLPQELGETIPDFHNMEFRLSQLREACRDNIAGRLQEPEVQALLAELEQRADEMTYAERLFRQGKLPKRVCHCDTKVNNMLFSEDGREVLCVIDLDTVMPSFIFSDYGDFLRTAANTVAEDEDDFSRIALRQDIYEAFTQGYLSAAHSFLTPIEVQMLPYAVRLFPYMQSVRFLWDYLRGDQYWKVKYPKHNLVRAQNQLHYLQCIEQWQFEHEAKTLECVNWPETYPYKPDVKVQVKRDDENLYVHFRVSEQSVRAVAQHDQDHVWEDSCVEFFCQPNPADGIYYNFECNCAGRLLLAAGTNRDERKPAPKEITDKVLRYATLAGEPFEERMEQTTWEVKLRIPRTAFFLHDIPSLANAPLRFNAYKCGDKLTTPHFLSLYPIVAPHPNFHLPEFFQPMQ